MYIFDAEITTEFSLQYWFVVNQTSDEKIWNHQLKENIDNIRKVVQEK